MSADHREKYNIPDDFCGLCDVCGTPSHICAYPPPIPFTGVLCATCYSVKAKTAYQEMRDMAVKLNIPFTISHSQKETEE
ncbi:MAG: hypothetical protein KAS32_23360 [Candidatus Peribacteraceae bacterium]|nr:hypothetical protein [Candidatus Peribacteraceae bacterium]